MENTVKTFVKIQKKKKQNKWRNDLLFYTVKPIKHTDCNSLVK